MSPLRAEVPPVAATTGGDEQKEIKMQDIQLFNFNNNEVRVIEKGGEPLFCGLDVCSAMGYKDPGKTLTKHLSRKSVLFWLPTSHGLRPHRFISEQDIRLISSKAHLKSVGAFDHWFNTVLLPALTKKDGDEFTDATQTLVRDLDRIIQSAAKLKEELGRHSVARTKTQAAPKQLKPSSKTPSARSAHKSGNRSKLLTPAEVSKMLSVSTNTLARWRESNSGPAFIQLAPKMIRYELADVKAWKNSRKQVA